MTFEEKLYHFNLVKIQKNEKYYLVNIRFEGVNKAFKMNTLSMTKISVYRKACLDSQVFVCLAEVWICAKFCCFLIGVADEV